MAWMKSVMNDYSKYCSMMFEACGDSEADSDIYSGLNEVAAAAAAAGLDDDDAISCSCNDDMGRDNIKLSNFDDELDQDQDQDQEQEEEEKTKDIDDDVINMSIEEEEDEVNQIPKSGLKVKIFKPTTNNKYLSGSIVNIRELGGRRKEIIYNNNNNNNNNNAEDSKEMMKFMDAKDQDRLFWESCLFCPETKH